MIYAALKRTAARTIKKIRDIKKNGEILNDEAIRPGKLLPVTQTQATSCDLS